MNSSETHTLGSGSVTGLWSLDEDPLVVRNGTRDYESDSYDIEFSGDTQYNASYSGAYTSQYSFSGSWARTTWDIYTRTFDVEYVRPPAIHRTWTAQDFQTFESGGLNVSRHPPHATLSDSNRGWILDAHITRFAQNPATYALLGNDTAFRYVGQTGTIRGIVGYRINTPSGIREENGDRLRYTLQSTSVSEVCVLEYPRSADISPQQSGAGVTGDPATGVNAIYNSTPVVPPVSDAAIGVDTSCDQPGIEIGETQSGSQTPVVEYESSANHNGSRWHVLAAEIEAVVEVTTFERVKRESCSTKSTPFGEATACSMNFEWIPDETHTETDSITVADAWPVTVYAFEQSQVVINRFPNGDIGIVLNSQTPWQGIQVGSSDISGSYRYFTARDPRWDSLIATSSDGQTSAHSEIHPVRSYVFPSSIDVQAIREPGVSVEIIQEYSDTTFDPPIAQIPANVRVSLAQERFTPTEQMVIRTGNISLDRVHAYGFVNGSRRPITDFPGTIETRTLASNLSLAVIDNNDTHTHLGIWLEGPDGTPIDTSTRQDSHLVIEGEYQVNTDTDGQIEVIVPETGYITVQYESAPWYELIGERQSYTDARARILSRVALFSLDGLVFASWLIFIVALPFLMVTYWVDRFFGYDLWPPWRD